jgi:hypothetical protein
VGGVSELMWTGAWLMIAALVAMVGAVLAARVVRERCQRPAESQPFTLQTLRELRASGQITEVEYNAMRGALLSEVRKPAEPDVSGLRGGQEPQAPPEGAGGAEGGE